MIVSACAAVGVALVFLSRAGPTDGSAQLRGPVLFGVYTLDVRRFIATVGRRPALRSTYTANWDPRRSPGEAWRDLARRATAIGARPEIHWGPDVYEGSSASRPRRRLLISFGAIARGRGDEVILASAVALRRLRQPVYLRFAAEMNGWWESYAAFERDGRPRGKDLSPAAYVAAWRRIRTIFRESNRRRLDARLTALGQPPLQARAATAPGAPNVRFVWAPNVQSDPMTAQNQPRAFYPGDRYVDVVGTSVYEEGNPTILERLLDGLYAQFPGKPFALSEWGSSADDPEWFTRIFGWVASHSRVRFMTYYDAGVDQVSSQPRAAERFRELASTTPYLVFGSQSGARSLGR